jgi:serine protease Do
VVITDRPAGATYVFHSLVTVALFMSCLFSTASEGHDLRELVKKAKPSIVGIGTLEKTRRPPSVLMATGFVIGDGSLIATNAHAIPELDNARREQLVIFIGTGRIVETRPVTVVATDKTHDLVILRQLGAPLPALKLAAAKPYVEEGSAVAFIGFPLGSVLGLYPVTHSGILAAVTPVVIPAVYSNTLSAEQVRAIKNPYFVYQLDATAYPGNSGSPLLDPQSGEVTAVINKVFVNSKKENVLSEPSGITYAIPVKHIHALMKRT